ncbi:MAG TPA: ABC transporter ATP-binding protein [Rhizobiaceae bacterium]|nr:ABC transporter ATP-binding protein [Rhizobiaceae bacterium]
MIVEAVRAPIGPLAPRVNGLRDFSDFAAHMFRVAGRRAGFALLFLILGSLMEGISILLLIPILQLAGAGDANFDVRVPDVQWLAGITPSGTISLAAALSFLVMLVAAQAVFVRFKSVYMARLLDDFVNTTRLGLFESIGRARWSIFTRMRASDLEHALNADIERVQGCGYYVLLLLQSLVLLAAYTLISLLISLPMTLFAIGLGAIMFAALRPFRRRATVFGQVITANRQGQYRTVSDFFSGMKVAKSLNVESIYFDRLRSALQKIKADNARYVGASTIGSALFQIASVIGLAVFVHTAFTRYGLSLAEVVVMLVVFMRVAPRFMDIQTNIQQMLVNLPSFVSMRELKARFDAEREESDARVDTGKLSLVREIAFHDVSFGYGDRLILDRVAFAIPAGKVTAVIGPSGSGKSTIADLLLGLLEPTHGSISVDGVPIGGSTRRGWRNQVAYVPQDVFLLHDTIAANLRLAAPQATDQDLWDALHAAHAQEFVRRLEAGLESVVGDRGVRLSGGERQRIALARALMRRPSLLVLDEATSALDWENQALIAESIKALRGSMTIVTIAHRPSMIAFADRVVAIEKGRAVEEGDYQRMKQNEASRLSKLLSGEHSEA